MEDDYVLRSATAEDAALIARHRGLMFLDMKLISEEEAAALTAATKPWILGLMQNGGYRGWFLEYAGEVVTTGGLHIRERGPVPGSLRVGRSAHIANVYTVPAHRRRGLARRLMREMLNWCLQMGIEQATLAASEEGQDLYASLGFEPVREMKLTFSCNRTW